MGTRRTAFVFATLCASALAGCANVIGLDGLVFDRKGDGGAGSSGTLSTTGEPSSTDATSTGATQSTTQTTSTGDGGGSPASSSSDGSSSSTTTGTGGAGGGFAVTGDGTGYTTLMGLYDAAFYRFEEEATGMVAVDSGIYDWDGSYEVGSGTITLGVPGVFGGTDTAMTIGGGAFVEVPRQGAEYYFDVPTDGGAFTLSFFAKLDAPPASPITVASCFDEAAQRGWFVRIDSRGVVLERHGEDAGQNPIEESTTPMPFPSNGGWHLVTIQRLSGAGQPLRGFIDDEQLLSDTTSTIIDMQLHSGLMMFGSDPLADGTAPPITLDEVVFSFYGLNDDQLEAQVACLQQGDCAPP